MHFALLVILGLPFAGSQELVHKRNPKLVSIQGSPFNYLLDDPSGIVLGFSTDHPHWLRRIRFLSWGSRSRVVSPIHGNWNCSRALASFDADRPLVLAYEPNLVFSRHYTQQFSQPFHMRFLAKYSTFYGVLYRVDLCFIDSCDLKAVTEGKGVDPGILKQWYLVLGGYMIGWHATSDSPFGCLLICKRK